MADSRIVTEPQPDSPPNSKPQVSRGARACTVCRAAKMKCVGAEDDGAKPCQRCRRSNVECIFEKHRRGRKPGSNVRLSEASKMLRKLEKGLNSSTKVKPDDPAPRLPYPISDSRDDQPYPARYSPRDLYVPSQAPRSANTSPATAAAASQFTALTAPYPSARYPDPAPPAASSSSAPSIDEDEDDDDKDAIYPAKMVEREGRRHSFFGTILNHPDESTSAGRPPPRPTQSPSQPAPHPRLQISIPRLPTTRYEDPVSLSIIAESELPELFNKVFLRLNPFVNLFDPSLHTPAYIRARCPFLFTVLVMAGCKFWRPEHFKACQRLAEEYCVRAFQESWKRVEVVQAFACMTYWREPDDTRTWTFIGYACRLAVELGMNTFCRTPPPDETPLQRLERRNRERTFLVLWVHDRSLSMQTGRQWMMPEDDLVRNSETWHEGSTLLPIDVVISAQVQLRRIAAEVTDVFYLHKGAAGAQHTDVNYEILLRGCNGKLNLWGHTWNAALKQARGEKFHYSLLAFFRLHVRLFLNSFGVQSHVPPSLSALTVCYTSALDTLRLVTKDFANIDMLRYGQDSITVMTAYSAIVLLKLLRMGAQLDESAPEQVHELITAAADAYQHAAKGMPPSSSVEYHGRFLHTLVVKDRARQERRREHHRHHAHVSPPGYVAADAAGVDAGGGAGLHQPQPTHVWHFPASPHLPAHPLVSPEHAGYGQEQAQVQEGGYTQKMEVAYWYNIHSGLGYGNGPGVNAMPAAYTMEQQQAAYPVPQYAG